MVDNAQPVEVILVGCCGKKGQAEAPARELYQSPLFKLAREYAELRGGPWAILSAKHGLVMPEQYLEPYDFRFRDLKAAQTRPVRSPKAVMERWGREVQGELKRRWPGARFELLAGEEYGVCLSGLDTVTVAGRSQRTGGLVSVEPLTHMSVGERLSWLKREIADLKARAWARGESAAPASEELEPVPALTEEVERSECDFCGEPVECAVSELGHQRFEGDDVPARICESCATWALEKIRSQRATVPA